MAEIEIEKKFLLTETQKRALLADATQVGDTSIEDPYFDTDDYELTLKDYWLRLRNGKYELKAPLKLANSLDENTNRYRELDTLSKIGAELNLDSFDTLVNFEASLLKRGIKRFMTVYTARESFKKAGFEIDIDQATYENSNFIYAVAELELLVEDESQASEAEARIIEFAQQFGLTTDQFILGKVGAFMKEERPEHYKALVEAGVFK